MFKLKPIMKEAVPRALERAERYRLLNEPAEAESICRDVLEIEPGNRNALITLLLSLTDQFAEGVTVDQAQELLPRLVDKYEGAYYAGIICERWAKAQMNHGAPGSGFVAHDWFHEAMAWYEKAQAVRPAGNDDAILRWNTCARILMKDPNLKPGPEERSVDLLE